MLNESVTGTQNEYSCCWYLHVFVPNLKCLGKLNIKLYTSEGK